MAAGQNLFETNNESLTGARATELLTAVCPDHVIEGGCNVCPHGDGGEWKLQSGITGHFAGAASENIVLSMTGCEPHAANFGGSVLLTKRAGKWRRLWYQSGAITDTCRKIPLADHREVLFCEGSYMGSGTLAQSLYAMDLSLPEEKRFTQLVLVEDTMGACFAGAALRKAFIEKVEFPDLNADGMPDLRVSLQTGTTKKFTEAEIAKYCPDALPQPVTRRTTLEFLFQGNHKEQPLFRRRPPANGIMK
jgi:hypothetical protein